jgi:hypothetical protein
LVDILYAFPNVNKERHFYFKIILYYVLQRKHHHFFKRAICKS